MKLLSMIGLTMLLTACHAAQPQEEPSHPIQNQATAHTEQPPFTVKLIAEKEEFRVGEKPEIRAELIYNGDQEKVTIAHGGSWVFLETTNMTENYHFGAAMNEPLIHTTLTKGTPIVEAYQFSGSTYIEGQEGEKYSEDIYQKMASMNFPVGQYEIKGITNFSLEGKSYQIEARIVFEVVE